uniref:Uncharacterized protein n=1 Tax=uncultured prokaryote TaxID=198431 RepID=A0A0H5Q2U4_9ZZZZ|nr:hypothetical protein [uncultured prokaryote]
MLVCGMAFLRAPRGVEVTPDRVVGSTYQRGENDVVAHADYINNSIVGLGLFFVLLFLLRR